MLERWNDDRMDALEARVAGLATLLLERQRETYKLQDEMRQQIGELRSEVWEEIRELRRELR